MNNCDASYSSFEPVLFVHCLAALDLGAGVEQPFDCIVIKKRQVVQSMGQSMDWTFEDNMVDGLFSAPHSQASEVAIAICVSRSGNVRHR